jgi:hypothetical protein
MGHSKAKAGLPGGVAARNDGDEAAEGGGRDRCPFCGSAVAGEAGVRLVPGRNRTLQVRQNGGRKLFGKARKEVFLNWFAATANVGFACERAGVTRQTVSRHRLSDPAFAAAYHDAIALGVPDLQARLQAWLNGRPKLDAHGALQPPDEEAFDPQLALQILREQQRMIAGHEGGPGQPRKQGRRPKVATNAQVKEALVKALKAFGVRTKPGIVAGEGGEGA